MRVRCTSTGPTVVKSRAATSRFVRPAATSRHTRSALVNGRGVGEDWRGAAPCPRARARGAHPARRRRRARPRAPLRRDAAHQAAECLARHEQRSPVIERERGRLKACRGFLDGGERRLRFASRERQQCTAPRCRPPRPRMLGCFRALALTAEPLRRIPPPRSTPAGENVVSGALAGPVSPGRPLLARDASLRPRTRSAGR